MLLRRGGGVCVCGPLRSLAAAGRQRGSLARGSGFALLYVVRSARVCVWCAATRRFCMQRIRAARWRTFGTAKDLLKKHFRRSLS